MDQLVEAGVHYAALHPCIKNRRPVASSLLCRTDASLLPCCWTSMDMFMLGHRNPITLYSVEQLHQVLGSTIQHLLFIHAITGCDTTSALYEQGKVKALNLAQKQDENLCSHMDVFSLHSSTREDVTTADEQFLLILYGAGHYDTLNKYRYVT